jgi:YD repeat-containing protein
MAGDFSRRGLLGGLFGALAAALFGKRAAPAAPPPAPLGPAAPAVAGGYYWPGGVTTYTYDGKRCLTYTADALGFVTTTTYDSAGRLVCRKVAGPAGEAAPDSPRPPGAGRPPPRPRQDIAGA